MLVNLAAAIRGTGMEGVKKTRSWAGRVWPSPEHPIKHLKGKKMKRLHLIIV